MAEDVSSKADVRSSHYEPPVGREKNYRIALAKAHLDVRAVAEWTTLRRGETPAAEIFSVAYFNASSSPIRPITFVFNGGPGASSAYLHLGALGPKSVTFTSTGGLPQSSSLSTNPDTWLLFTDLVFVDPIGTGLSRVLDEVKHEHLSLPPDDPKTANPIKEKGSRPYLSISQDLDSIGEFVQRFLARHNRWLSPLFLCGESYGGYRVGRLVRTLPEKYGVGVAGAVLVSPALELNSLEGSDYDVVPWVERFPSFALCAKYHGKAKRLLSLSDDEAAKVAIEFALTELARFLMRGSLTSDSERLSLVKKASDLVGVSPSFIDERAGRIGIVDFVNELLKEERLVLGCYDGAQTCHDPFPDRSGFHTPDPTLHQFERIFTSGIYHLLWGELGLTTQRRYHLLSYEVHQSWTNDLASHVFNVQMGATDDLRYGMSLNPHLKVWVTHGIYDLVTPFFSSERLQYHMKLPSALRTNLSFSRYQGGHMFYTWERSRKEFSQDAKTFFQHVVPDLKGPKTPLKGKGSK